MMPPAPEHIGSYPIERLLARTELSEVFVGRDASGRRVCIKRLQPGVATKNAQAALGFRREAAVLAEVENDHVVRVEEVGEHDGQPFMVMELLEGHSLEQKLQDGPLSIDRTIEIIRQAADGLSRVHDRDLVHADIKPANLLLSERDKGLVVKLVDFGLAAHADASIEGLAGTPHYMAPEQTGMVDWNIGPATDLYALGVVAYECLAGEPPFDATDLAQLLTAHVSQQPPALSQRRDGLPPILAQIVHKLLAKEPSKRYRSAAGLAQDLARLAQRLEASDPNPRFPLDTGEDVTRRIGQVFVGRGEELGALERAFERARSGQSNATFVAGVAGVGKSALLREFQNRSIASGARFIKGKCYEFARGLPYYGLAEILTDYLHQLERLPAQRREREVELLRDAVGSLAGDLIQLVAEFAKIFPDAEPSAYLGEGRDRIRLLQVLTRAFEAMARGAAPLVILLDDLQAADAGTLAAVESIVAKRRDCPLLVVGTYRKEEVGSDHPLQSLLELADRTEHVGRVSVDTFDRDQTRLLLGESLRQASTAVPQFLVDRVFEHTEGNPLFIGEMLKALWSAGAIETRGGRLAVDAARLEAADLPKSVLDVVLRRAHDLEAGVRTVIGTAALMGRGFTLDQLARATARRVEAVFDATQQGIAAQLLQPPRRGQFRFHHDRVQEACTRLISETDRAVTHGRILDALEATQADEDIVFDLAEHAVRAGDDPRAWGYCQRAAREAKKRHANEQALRYFETALNHARGDVPVTPESLREVRLSLAEVYDLSGRYEDAGRTYELVLDAERDDHQRARILTKLGLTQQKQGDYAAATKAFEQALSLVGLQLRDDGYTLATIAAKIRQGWGAGLKKLVGPSSPDTATEVAFEIMSRLWLSCVITDVHRARYLTERLLAEVSRLTATRELAVVHRMTAVTLAQQKRPPWNAALRHGHLAVQIAQQAEQPIDAGVAMLYTADLYCWSARFLEALPLLQSARELLSSLGNMWELANVHIFSYIAHRGAGQLDEAMSHAHALVELGERIGAKGTVANGHQKIAEILLMRGDETRGESHLARSFEIIDEKNLKFDRFGALKIRGVSRLSARRFADARAELEAAIDLAEQPGVAFLQAYVSEAYLYWAEAYLKDEPYIARSGGLAADEGQRAARYIEQRMARERHLRWHLGLSYRIRGLLRWRQGRLAAARKDLDRALTLFEQQSRPIESAQTRLDMAAIFGTLEPEAAAQWVRQARVVYEQRGMKPMLEVCDSELERLGHAPRQLPAASDGTTKALREVMEISRMLMEARDPNAVLERIVKSSMALLGAERGFIFIRENPEQPLRFAVGRTADGTVVSEKNAQVSRSVLHRVDETGEGLAVADTEADESLRDKQSIAAYNLRSVLCAPLRHTEQKIGVLYLDSQITTALFGEVELDILRMFASHAAVALLNARQFRTIQSMNEELDAKVLERTRELEQAYVEIESSMQQLRDTTLRLAEAKREALEKEIQVAQNIQMAMVPHSELIEHDDAQIAGVVLPASLCGGDLWTYVEVGGNLVLMVGDVTGHGVGSAMITTVAKSCLDTLVLESRPGVSLDTLFATMSDVICGVSEGKMTMTAFAAEIDAARGEVRYCAAGHNPQYLLSRQGRLVPLFSKSYRLGDGRGRTFVPSSAPFHDGDLLVLYTDGLTECTNAKGEQYGDRRFRRVLRKHASDPADEVRRVVLEDVARHRDGHPPDDDVTLVIAGLRSATPAAVVPPARRVG